MNNVSSKTVRTKWLVASVAIAGFAALFATPVLAKTSSAPATTSGDASTADDSNLRLSLDKVDLYVQSGKYSEAQDLIEKLKVQYPGNPDVLAAEADINGQHYQGERSEVAGIVSDLCAPNTLAPNSLDLLQRESLQGSGARSFVCGDYNRRITNQALEQIESFTGQVALPYPGIRVDFDLENDHTNSREPFEYSNGTTRSFYNDRQQGTVMLQKTFSNRDVAGVSIYGNNNTPGAGLQYVMTDRWGGTSVQANYHQPDWDYVEMIAQNGTKDNLRIERKMVFNQNFQAVLSGGYTHYELENLGDAADAPGWNLAVDYVRPVHIFDQGDNDPAWYSDQVTLGAHYGVDAEYFTFVNRLKDSTAQPFHPLPATSYEVHSFTGSIGKTILPNVDAELDGGYGVNRWNGSSGPVYGGVITYTPIQHLGIDIHASRTLLGGENNGGKEDITGASLKWIW